MKLLLCFFPYLRVIFVSCRHLIASISKVSFITTGSAWACNFVPPLSCQQPSPYIHCVQVYLLLLLLMVLLFHLDIFFHEQLDVFIDRQVNGHLINFIPSCAPNGVFDSSLLEVVVPMLLRGKWTSAMPGDITTLMASNLLVENQNKLEDWHAIYLSGDGEDCAIFTRRLETNCQNCARHSPGCREADWVLELHNAQSILVY